MTQLAISRARDRNQTQVYWPQSTMPSQIWKLREQWVSLCLCDDQLNNREHSSCACPAWPPALWTWRATEQPLSWLHDFPVSGKTRGQGPASFLLLPYFLYNSVFKLWLWLPQQTCLPGDHVLACSGWQLAWPHRLSAGRLMFRILPACSLLLQPPGAMGLRRGACCACWSVFSFTSQSMVFSLGKNTEGCFLLVLVGHLSWGWISRRRWWRVIDDDDDGSGDGDNEGKHRPSNPTHVSGNTPKNNLFGGLLMEWTFHCHFSWDIDNSN